MWACSFTGADALFWTSRLTEPTSESIIDCMFEVVELVGGQFRR